MTETSGSELLVVPADMMENLSLFLPRRKVWQIMMCSVLPKITREISGLAHKAVAPANMKEHPSQTLLLPRVSQIISCNALQKTGMVAFGLAPREGEQANTTENHL